MFIPFIHLIGKLIEPLGEKVLHVIHKSCNLYSRKIIGILEVSRKSLTCGIFATWQNWGCLLVY